MDTREGLVAAAEESVRADMGIAWDFHDGRASRFHTYNPYAQEKMLATGTQRAVQPQAGTLAATAACTNGATYTFDGSLEGMFTAIHAAFCAHDVHADILPADQLQPRLGQEVVDVPTCLDEALKVRRLVEYALGTQAFRCIRSAASAESGDRGTIIYRFLRYALPASKRNRCSSCNLKATCTKACETPLSCALLDDLSIPEVFNLMQLYRSVVNERHLMLQFIRFEHCEGDVWFARCNPKANVVPLLMDWFIARFNDQKFVIYDENHDMSGVYDGSHWYLVASDTITPPPHMEDERMMREAWRRFYRAIGVEARYNPELRRGFMPMRLWRNLPEMD